VSGYYAYIIGKDGHVINRVVIEGADDEEARRKAKQIVDGHDVELWQEARKVNTFPRKK
jgi:hypothetical protein